MLIFNVDEYKGSTTMFCVERIFIIHRGQLGKRMLQIFAAPNLLLKL